MEDPVIIAALITLIGVIGTAIITGLLGGLRYFFKKNPIRNGLEAHLNATVKLTEATLQLNRAHDDFKEFMLRSEDRNRKEHKAILDYIEKLADVIAPRQPVR